MVTNAESKIKKYQIFKANTNKQLLLLLLVGVAYRDALICARRSIVWLKRGLPAVPPPLLLALPLPLQGITKSTRQRVSSSHLDIDNQINADIAGTFYRALFLLLLFLFLLLLLLLLLFYCCFCIMRERERETLHRPLWATFASCCCCCTFFWHCFSSLWLCCHERVRQQQQQQQQEEQQQQQEEQRDNFRWWFLLGDDVISSYWCVEVKRDFRET